MSHLMSMLKWEFVLQTRNRMVHATFGSIALYLTLLEVEPALNTYSFRVLILLMDPALLGLLFIGVLVLFEKGERTIHALNVTPMKTSEYLLSKVISLTLLSVASSLVLATAVGIGFGVWFDPAFVLVGAVLTSTFLSLLGFLVVCRYDTIEEYLVAMIGIVFLLVMPPLIGFLVHYESWLLYIFPAQASLILFSGAYRLVAAPDVMYAMGYLAVLSVLCYLSARRAYYRHIVVEGY